MRTLSTLLLLGVMTFSGCNGNNTNSTASFNKNGSASGNTNGNSNLNFSVPPPIKPTSLPDANFKSCNPAFPLVPGSQAKYMLQFSSPLVADVIVVVDKAEENGQTVFIEKTQIIDKSGGLYKYELTERKYLCDNGRIQLLSEKTDNRTEKGSSKMEMELRGPAVALQDPGSLARKGTSWSYSFTPVISLPDTQNIRGDLTMITFEVLGQEKVKVPAGEFNAIKVQRKVKDSEVIDYLVPGIGLVKRTSKEGTFWELKEFSGLRELN